MISRWLCHYHGCLADTLQYITAPTKRAYQQAARVKEKEQVSQRVKNDLLPGIKEALGQDVFRKEAVLGLLRDLCKAAKSFYHLHANPALTEYIPGYLDPSPMVDMQELCDGEGAGGGFKEVLSEIIERFEAAIKLETPEGLEIRSLHADEDKARHAWRLLKSKFNHLLFDDRIGNQQTYLLRCAHTHKSTTRATLSILYAETFMLVEETISPSDLRTQLMEIAEAYHPLSPHYHSNDARNFRRDDEGGL